MGRRNHQHNGRVIELGLAGNQLSGEIPPELGYLANLTVLWLGGNQLSGEIPPELGYLANLGVLYLDENQLSGEIPPELGNLDNLGLLYLGGNQLSGEIPPELGTSPTCHGWPPGEPVERGDTAEVGQPRQPVRLDLARTS